MLEEFEEKRATVEQVYSPHLAKKEQYAKQQLKL